MLNVENLNVYYGKNHILKNLNLNVEKNDFISIVGTNGSGKTTFFKALLGLVDSEGKITYKNESIEHLSTDKRIKKGISISHQSGEIFNNLTVNENLALACYIKKKKVDVHFYRNDIKPFIYFIAYLIKSKILKLSKIIHRRFIGTQAERL